MLAAAAAAAALLCLPLLASGNPLPPRDIVTTITTSSRTAFGTTHVALPSPVPDGNGGSRNVSVTETLTMYQYHPVTIPTTLGTSTSTTGSPPATNPGTGTNTAATDTASPPGETGGAQPPAMGIFDLVNAIKSMVEAAGTRTGPAPTGTTTTG
jgi:hypothetical protein